MQDRLYVLRLDGQMEGDSKLYRFLPAAYREKIDRIKDARKQMSSLGGGLLLQLAAREFLETSASSPATEVIELEFAKLVQKLGEYEEPLPIELAYGPQGKPYVEGNRLDGAPFYYNISHSGEYVVCAVSDREVGVDIQKQKEMDYLATSKKFFAGEESIAIERYPVFSGRNLFYRLWTYKEAYGKMTGQGVTAYLSQNMLDYLDKEGAPWQEKNVCVEEFSHLPGYHITLCKKCC